MSNRTILELPEGTDLPQSVLDELNMRLLWIGKQIAAATTPAAAAAAAPGAAGGTITGTRNERLNVAVFAAQNYPGFQFHESDTGLIYISGPIETGGAGYVWRYASGTWSGTYANLPASLGGYDSRLLYQITNKGRTLKWSGTGWGFAPWEVIPPGFVAGFRDDPGTGWHICDGTFLAGGELHSDGTPHDVTVEDFSAGAYPKWGPTAAGFQAAIAPGFTGSTASGVADIQPSAAAIGAGAAVIGNDSGGGQAVQSGSGVTVAAHTHNHSDSGHVHVDSGHDHTDAGHVHGKGTLAVDDTGEPVHYDLVAYQRL